MPACRTGSSRCRAGRRRWRLAGLELERDTRGRRWRRSARRRPRRRAQLADDVIRRFGIRRIDRATLDSWLGESGTRTTYLLDVRTPDEYAAGHLPGSVSAEGGQLVQAIDRWVGTRGARLVLVDDTGTRAIMTAHWLTQMGWDVVVLDRAFDGQQSARPASPSRSQRLPDVPVIGAAEAGALAQRGRRRRGRDHAERAITAKAHPEGAVWAIRPRLDRLPESVLRARRVVVFADDAGGRRAGCRRSRGDCRRGRGAGAGRASRAGAPRHPFAASPGRSARCRPDRLYLLEPRSPRRQPGGDARLSALGDRTARRRSRATVSPGSASPPYREDRSGPEPVNSPAHASESRGSRCPIR